MVRVMYIKTTSVETDDHKILGVHFTGSRDGVKFDLKVSGVSNQIEDLKNDLKLETYGQLIDLDVSNNQSGLTDFKEDKQ